MSSYAGQVQHEGSGLGLVSYSVIGLCVCVQDFGFPFGFISRVLVLGL